MVDQPGFYGWPYCVRNNVPYNDYNFATGVAGPTVQLREPGQQLAQQHRPDEPAARTAGHHLARLHRARRALPVLGTGGAPTGGPRYDYDPANASTTKFPEFYDGKWFIGEWNEGWIKTATLNDDGSARGVGAFDLETGYLRPMDIEFGPDGSLYVIEWGSGFGGNNLDSGIYRIDYVGEGRRPIAQATATPDSGPVAAHGGVLERGLERPRRHGAHVRLGLQRRRHDRLDRAQPDASHTQSPATTPRRCA